MNKILGTGLMSVLLLSGAAFAQGQGNIVENARSAAGAAAQDSNALLSPAQPVVEAEAGESGEVVTSEVVIDPVVVEPVVGIAVIEPETPVVPGADAPVILSPEALSGAGIASGQLNADLIGRTSQMGQDIFLLQQNKQFLDQIKLTVDMIGIENTLAMYPQYASFLDTSPLALSSQLTRVQTLNQLREEMAKAETPAAEPQIVETVEGGNSLMDMQINEGTAPVQPAEAALTRDEVARLIEEARMREEAEVESQPAVRTTPVYGLILEEIYGANSQMVAVISDGGSTYKVRMGDEIPDVGRITMISRDGVTVATEEDEHLVRFR